MNHETIKKLWQRYRYACAVLILGLILLWIPGRKNSTTSESIKPGASSAPTTEKAEQRLAEVLSKTKGVGEVRVLLSYESSEERFYTKDDGETVLINTGSGKQEALEKKVVYPTYQGAIIVCSGAEDASVQMRVIEAVRQYTGLQTDQISVLPLA